MNYALNENCKGVLKGHVKHVNYTMDRKYIGYIVLTVAYDYAQSWQNAISSNMQSNRVSSETYNVELVDSEDNRQENVEVNNWVDIDAAVSYP